MFAAYVAITVTVLGLFLWHLHSNARDAGFRLAHAFALVAEEQSVVTIMGVEQALELIEREAAAAGTEDFARLSTRDRGFLQGAAVIRSDGSLSTARGTLPFDSELAQQPYVRHHYEVAGSRFHISRPTKLADGTRSIPVSRAIRDKAGNLSGIVVAAVDPRLFDRGWQADRAPGYVVSLSRINGELLMRTPFDDAAFSEAALPPAIRQHLISGAMEGHALTPAVGGSDQLVIFRRLAEYPNLVVSIAVPWQRLFAEWWTVVRMVAIGWFLGVLAVAALTVWIVRESIARARTQRRFRMLFDANPYPILVVHRSSGRILAANQAAAKQYRASREELLRSKASSLAGEGERDFVSEGLAKPGEVLSGFVHRRTDGSVFDADITVQPTEFADAPAVVAIVHDVSQRAHLERERTAAEDKLRQSQKMEAVGQLTGGVAHDFNNILMVILASVEALQEEAGLDHQVAKRLDRIGEAVQRASDLTRQLLAFSRKQPLKPELTDINELVRRTAKMLQRSLGEHIEIRMNLAAEAGPADVDRTQLETALLNLCLNARDAMKTGGKLLIETSNIILDEGYADTHQEVAPGEYSMVSVSDTGSGIPKDTISKIFDPFFTTKEVGKGTGLGLSMVYGFIKQSKGHVSVYSEVGRGTTFKLFLPRAAAKASASIIPLKEHIPGGRERILVVEDERPVREMVVDQLRSLGYAVEHAEDGDAALHLLKSASRPFDLLLTDVVMPGNINGKALADEVLKRWTDIRIVFMSGYTQDAIAQHGELEPGTLLLSKPFRKRDLALVLRKALKPKT